MAAVKVSTMEGRTRPRFKLEHSEEGRFSVVVLNRFKKLARQRRAERRAELGLIHAGQHGVWCGARVYSCAHMCAPVLSRILLGDDRLLGLRSWFSFGSINRSIWLCGRMGREPILGMGRPLLCPWTGVRQGFEAADEQNDQQNDSICSIDCRPI